MILSQSVFEKKIKDQQKLSAIQQNELKDQAIEANDSPTQEGRVKKVKRKKKQQSLFLYWACIMCNMLLSYVNIPIFMITDVMVLIIVVMAVVMMTYVVYFANSCIIAQTKADICYLYFLFDSIFVAKCTAIVGLFGLLMIMLPIEVPVVMMAVLINMDLFIFSGNCRIILAYCKYKKWQVIIFKMSLILCLILYLVLASYFMTNPSFIPASEQNQDIIKDFFFLYVFGLFTLYLEIFIKVSDLDGTNDLQYYYYMNPEEQVEVTLLNEDMAAEKENIQEKENSYERKPVEISFV